MTSPATSVQAPFELPEEERSAGLMQEEAKYRALLARLSHQSVVKHYEAYRDIPWDDAEYAIDPADPRWELLPTDTLGGTDWYQAQPQAVRARLGLHMIASNMTLGHEFENVLKRGLLEFALRLPNDAPERRYVYHEVIEEAQHALMFQEFVRRTGLPVSGMPRWMEFGSRQVVRFARSFPELFFLFVLGGEDPIDHVQRAALASGVPMHPLLRRMDQIHVTEEARHLSFARAYLRRNVPRLSGSKLLMLRVRAPILLGVMAGQMLEPSRELIRTYGIPRTLVRQAYADNPEHHRSMLDGLRKVRELCVEVGIAVPPYTWLWRRMGIWQAA
ncbi:MAG: AurF N-oxygenase family protein [Myxococcota bacterium]